MTIWRPKAKLKLRRQVCWLYAVWLVLDHIQVFLSLDLIAFKRLLSLKYKSRISSRQFLISKAVNLLFHSNAGVMKWSFRAVVNCWRSWDRSSCIKVVTWAAPTNSQNNYLVTNKMSKRCYWWCIQTRSI